MDWETVAAAFKLTRALSLLSYCSPKHRMPCSLFGCPACCRELGRYHRSNVISLLLGWYFKTQCEHMHPGKVKRQWSWETQSSCASANQLPLTEHMKNCQDLVLMITERPGARACGHPSNTLLQGDSTMELCQQASHEGSSLLQSQGRSRCWHPCGP